MHSAKNRYILKVGNYCRALCNRRYLTIRTSMRAFDDAVELSDEVATEARVGTVLEKEPTCGKDDCNDVGWHI